MCGLDFRLSEASSTAESRHLVMKSGNVFADQNGLTKPEKLGHKSDAVFERLNLSV